MGNVGYRSLAQITCQSGVTYLGNVGKDEFSRGKNVVMSNIGEPLHEKTDVLSPGTAVITVHSLQENSDELVDYVAVELAHLAKEKRRQSHMRWYVLWLFLTLTLLGSLYAAWRIYPAAMRQYFEELATWLSIMWQGMW